MVPDYAAQAFTPGGAGTNENNDDLIPSNAATPGATPETPAPLPGLDSAGEAGHPLTLPLYGAAGLLVLALIAASPRMVRTGRRSRRLRRAPSPGGNTAAAAWAELRDLATDYGFAPGLSETPRHFSGRLRGSGALGGPDNADDAGARAVASLTADYERQQYGPPAGHTDGAAVAGAAAPSAADRIAVVQASLRRHSRAARRIRAEWLPPSVMNRWGRIASAPFRAIARAAAIPAQAAALSWRTVLDGLRRLRQG